MNDLFGYLLFDLGGVLVELTGEPDFMRWMNNSVTVNEFNERWLHSKAVREYESGRISSEAFGKAFVAEFGMKVSPDDFIRAFSKFPVGLYEGVESMLKSLSGRYPTACLSNTNPIHWEWMSKNTSIERLLGKCLLSFRTGMMKPDRETFLHAAKELGCSPHEIAFFDDNPANVAAAAEIGFNAFRVNGFSELKNKLAELGIL